MSKISDKTEKFLLKYCHLFWGSTYHPDTVYKSSKQWYLLNKVFEIYWRYATSQLYTSWLLSQ